MTAEYTREEMRKACADNYAAATAEAREAVAMFMMRHSLATGHGDTLADLLGELSWQLLELQNRVAALDLALRERASG